MSNQWNRLLAGLLLGGACCAIGGLPADEPPQRFTGAKRDWGEVRFTDRGLMLVVSELSAAKGAIRIPRLHNPLAAVYAEGDKDRAPLKLTPHVAEWEIALPTSGSPRLPLVIVVETVGPPRVAPGVARPTSGGVITLAAHDAVTHGQRLRYEPQPHKNTLGYWSDASDWCQWRLAAPPGKYEIQILQGCGAGQGGSEVALHVADQEIVFTALDTGHFQNFKRRTLGLVELTSGDGRANERSASEHTLELRPRNKKAAAVMDVRQVRLVPVGREQRTEVRGQNVGDSNDK